MLEWLNGKKTFIGIALSAVFKVLAMKGYLAEGASQETDHVVELIFGFVSLLGDAMATYGRLKVETPGKLSKAAKAVKES